MPVTRPGYAARSSIWGLCTIGDVAYWPAKIESFTTTRRCGVEADPSQEIALPRGRLTRSIQTGRGMADLQPYVENLNQTTKKRAALIARDQTSKATTAINQARMQGLGVKKFKWLHSYGGKEPRPLHKDVLNGKIFSLDNPPVIDERTGERGLPGVLINCRCRLSPVIEFKAEDATE